MKNIVVLISGNGSNLQAIIDACKQKKINGTIRAVFSNKADAFGLERAREANIPAHALEASQFSGREAFDRELVQEIDAYAPDVVVLAGYMRILSPAFVSHYSGRLLNIHPSLLPKYPACIPIARCWKTAMKSTGLRAFRDRRTGRRAGYFAGEGSGL
jgi:phosphoribosylglycinamide formyltransferase-1